MAQDAKSPYPNMMPIEQYLMDRTAGIARARSCTGREQSLSGGVMTSGTRGSDDSSWPVRDAQQLERSIVLRCVTIAFSRGEKLWGASTW
jgi:hypothetical protein